MRRFLLLLTLLGVVGFSGFAQTWTTSAAQEGNMPASWVCNFGGGGGVWGGDLWLSGTLPANVEFTFTGTQVRIVGIPVNAADFTNDGINSTVDISIDNVLVEDNYTGWIQNTSDVGNVLIWTSGTLTAGEHKIKVELNGNEIGINAFEYIGTPVAASTILDDTDAGWTWTGFAEDPKPECYGGNQHAAELTGSIAEFNFTGTKIEFYGETWAGAASFEIFIDNVSKGIFSQSIEPEGLQILFATITGLEDINHAVKMVTIGEWGSVDYVEYSSAVWTRTNVSAAATDPNFNVTDLGGGGIWDNDLWLGPNGFVEYTFTGSQVRIVGIPVNGADFVNDGMNSTADISIDGVLIEDNFTGWIQSTADIGNILIWTSAPLAEGEHTIKVFLNANEIGINAFEYVASDVIIPDPLVTVSSENPEWGEIASKLNDGDLNTKWSAPSSTAWIQFAYKEAKTWNQYSLTSGNDDPTRDFKDWTLQGSTDGVTWDILDTQTGQAWASRNSTIDFPFLNIKAYKFYKIDVTANNGNAGTIQLSEIAFSYEKTDALVFTTSGIAASYITWNNSTSLQSDSIYNIEKTKVEIIVDGEAEASWSEANTAVIKKIAHEKRLGDNLDLSLFPQSETDLYATYRALWTDLGVYMFIEVKDDMVRYQNPEYQWENDGIEFYFAKARGEGKIQIIIPAMVGTPHPSKPDAKTLETGSSVGSDAAYKVFGFDATNWDETLFNWAILKTATGYNVELYLDKDIATNGNSDTNFGLGKIFAGDINVDEADDKKNDNDPALFVREGTLALLGNSNQEYANSNYYGYFKMVDIATGVNNHVINSSDFNAFYNASNRLIIVRGDAVASVTLYNITGQAVSSKFIDGRMSVENLKAGIYIVTGTDANGNRIGSKKVSIY